MSLDPLLRIGDPQLDEDHQHLERAIGALALAQAPDRARVLEELRQTAKNHFESEDADLHRMDDGNAKCHVDEHAAVLRSLDEVGLVLASTERDEAFKAALVGRLGAELLKWLPMHVREMDTALVKFRVAQRFGGAPVTLARR